MDEVQGGCVFELDAGLILARLLGEEQMSPELFERLCACGQGLAEADGRGEISCSDLRQACELLGTPTAGVGYGSPGLG
jgi:hypothetical protein